MLTNDSTKYICQGIIDDRTIYDRTVKGETEIGNGGLHIVKITHEFISGENVGECIRLLCAECAECLSVC